MRAVAAGERSLELECGEGGVGSCKLIGTRTLSTFQGRHKQEQQYNTELSLALPCLASALHARSTTALISSVYCSVARLNMCAEQTPRLFVLTSMYSQLYSSVNARPTCS